MIRRDPTIEMLGDGGVVPNPPTGPNQDVVDGRFVFSGKDLEIIERGLAARNIHSDRPAIDQTSARESLH